VLVIGIKSKPVYAPLAADAGGRFHLMLGAADGAAPLLRVIGELREAAPEALARTQVLYAAEAAPQSPDTRASPATAAFSAAGIASTQSFESIPSLLAECTQVLDRASMGTRLYVAGPESFIGLAMKLALDFNLNQDEIRAEECGSRARRVHCVHCRRTTEQVRTNVVRCIGCARWLLVRDHYSRRLAAYMGVMVDAEAPGELPAIVEVFT
jgi:hypothetical protein